LSCVGHQTWVGSALTLIDALSTLAVLNRRAEFERAVKRVSKVNKKKKKYEIL
jgi:hypothetical protein